jgi:hypothetical protein
MSNSCGLNPGSEEGQFWSSFLFSAANMFGFGGLLEQRFPTPLDKLQDKIASERSKTQDYVNNATLAATKLLAEKAKGGIDNNLKLIRNNNQVLSKEMELHDEILREKISSNTVYIAVIFTILMIVYLYIILS